MGFENRDWAREPDPGVGLGAIGDSAVKVVLAINIAVFILWQIFDRSPFFASHFTVSPDGVLRDLHLHTLLTSGFSHNEIWHMAMNMLFIWWFGRELEESIYGSRGFLVLLIGGIMTASAAHVAIGYLQGYGNPALGASGGVMAILVVCAILFPDRPIRIFWGTFAIPLKWLVGIYLVNDMLPVITGRGTGIANAAHLGGALGGALFYYLDPGGFRVRGSGAESTMWRWPSFFGRGRRAAAAAPGVPLDDRDLHRPPPGIDDETAGRVDALLAKIAKDGMASLSDAERAFLSEASSKYKGKS